PPRSDRTPAGESWSNESASVVTPRGEPVEDAADPGAGRLFAAVVLGSALLIRGLALVVLRPAVVVRRILRRLPGVRFGQRQRRIIRLGLRGSLSRLLGYEIAEYRQAVQDALPTSSEVLRDVFQIEIQRRVEVEVIALHTRHGLVVEGEGQQNFQCLREVAARLCQFS